MASQLAMVMMRSGGGTNSTQFGWDVGTQATLRTLRELRDVLVD